MTTHSTGDDPVYIPTTQVRKRYGNPPVSKPWIDRKLERDPRFPRPYWFQKRRYWRIDELKEYERGLAREPATLST